MCVSQNNNRLFLAILLGMFMASGCSGHSVKYGANSGGEGGTSQEEEMSASVENAPHGFIRNADGTMINGGIVDGNNTGRGASQVVSQDLPDSQDTKSEMPGMNDASSIPGSADYGRKFNGVDGSGPNHGSVTGFGSGAAAPHNPDPEAWANMYLQEGKSQQDFYGDPSTSGSFSFGGKRETANYGHNYAGVPGNGPSHGAITGFSQGSASAMDINPETWAQAYVREHGGPAPEYIKPDMNISQASIAQANGHSDSSSIGQRESIGGHRAVGHASSGYEGRMQDIYFAFDSWSISDEGVRYLEEDAQWLYANPEKSLTIEGHCDQRGTQDYNLVLGKKRAEAAREYLINLGVQAYRVKIVSYGKERPFCHDNNEWCFQENRRNHMVVRMNQS